MSRARNATKRCGACTTCCCVLRAIRSTGCGGCWTASAPLDSTSSPTSAADEALIVLLTKLSTFEGRSRFTTWAYKFAILQVSTEVRRFAWRDREVPLDTGVLDADAGSSPEQFAEATDLAAATWSAIEQVLSPHQRSVTIALLVGYRDGCLVTGGRRRLTPEMVQRLIRDTRPWLPCEDCFQLLEQYVEALLADPDGDLAGDADAPDRLFRLRRGSRLPAAAHRTRRGRRSGTGTQAATPNLRP